MRTPRLSRPLLALLAATLAPAAALAADYSEPGEVLRGSYHPAPPPIDEVVQWQGAYLGAFGGYTEASYDTRRAFYDSTAEALRFNGIAGPAGLQGLSPASRGVGGGTFGGFAGYNTQMDEIVFGLEGDYTHIGLQGRGTDQVLVAAPGFSNGYNRETYLTGRASNELNGYGTLRARIGYTSGAFMPYVTGGLALGHATFTRAVGLREAGYNPANLADRFGYADFDAGTLSRHPLLAESVVRSKDMVVAGFAVGAGIDMAVTQNIFVRGEYQYAYFDSFEGNKFHLNTVRAAAGVRW